MNYDEPNRVYAPFYQVKVAGKVVTHTNNHEGAHRVLREASAKPAELWRINDGGAAQLLARIPA